MQEQRASGLIINPVLYFSCPLKGRGFQTNVTRSLKALGHSKIPVPQECCSRYPHPLASLYSASPLSRDSASLSSGEGSRHSLSVFCLYSSPEQGACLFFKSVSKSPKQCFHWLGLSPVPFPGWITVARDGLFSMAILASEPTSRVRM